MPGLDVSVPKDIILPVAYCVQKLHIISIPKDIILPVAYCVQKLHIISVPKDIILPVAYCVQKLHIISVPKDIILPVAYCVQKLHIISVPKGWSWRLHAMLKILNVTVRCNSVWVEVLFLETRPMSHIMNAGHVPHIANHQLG